MTAASGEKAIIVTPREAQPSRQGPAENFTGSVRVDQQFQAKAPGRVLGARVTFEPGARTAWHSHPLGQTLIVTSGVGRVQRWGDPVEEIRTGRPRVDPGRPEALARRLAHDGHDARRDRGDARRQELRLDGEGHRRAVRRPRPPAARPPPAAPAAAPAGQPTRAQRIMGDFAPKLAQLTDDVLYGDVWARPQLSPRDRSLVTISALIAMNRPDQLRSHLARARDNGVTEEEIVESITHLAFYAGWPSAVTAVGVARDVFAEEA